MTGGARHPELGPTRGARRSIAASVAMVVLGLVVASLVVGGSAGAQPVQGVDDGTGAVVLEQELEVQVEAGDGPSPSTTPSTASPIGDEVVTGTLPRTGSPWILPALAVGALAVVLGLALRRLAVRRRS